jgi:hypothetical protein
MLLSEYRIEYEKAAQEGASGLAYGLLQCEVMGVDQLQWL